MSIKIKLQPRQNLYNLLSIVVMSAGVNITCSSVLENLNPMGTVGGGCMVISGALFYLCETRSREYIASAEKRRGVAKSHFSAEEIAANIAVEKSRGIFLDTAAFILGVLLFIAAIALFYHGHVGAQLPHDKQIPTSVSAPSP